MIIFLIANGRVYNLSELKDYLKPDLVIAVNGGTNKALKYSTYPDIVIGDNDSIRKKVKSKLIKFPREKDKNDLELAVDYILANYQNFKLFCFGVVGNRMDHTLSNINCISKVEGYPPIIITAKETIFILGPNQSIYNINQNIKVSVLSIVYNFSMIEIRGLKYSGNFELPFMSSLGISNHVVNEDNFIKCKQGKIIVIVYQKYQKLNRINVER
ncbi:MAG: thiamine diphosphokinase [Candidatus Calescibacterium sp.]|nr:thiamine diphosphokinase [Candidatus Calescibacterium sp.]MDW8133138.1 thiamine diphosphokinase [Candidatus Calescibacterium sp.]